MLYLCDMSACLHASLPFRIEGREFLLPVGIILKVLPIVTLKYYAVITIMTYLLSYSFSGNE